MLEDVDALGFEVHGRDRVRDPDLGRGGRAGVERDQLQPERDRTLRPVPRRAGAGARGPRHRAVRRAHGGRTGPARAERRGAARARRGRRRRAAEVRREAGRGVDGSARELPREDEPGRGGVERPRPPVAVEGRDQRVRRRGRVGRTDAPVSRVGGRRRARAPAGGIAPPEPDHQLVQAPGPRAGSRRSTRHGATRTGRAPSARSARRVPSCGGSSAAARAPTRTRTSCSPRSRPPPRTGSGARRRHPPPRRRRLRARRSPELPGSLEAAIRAFEDDAALREALGKDFSDYYATSRAWELKAWRETVTEWERERYDRSV